VKTDDQAPGYSRPHLFSFEPLLIAPKLLARRGRIAGGKGLMASGLQSHHSDIHIARWSSNGRKTSALPSASGVRIYLDARSLFDGREFTRSHGRGGDGGNEAGPLSTT
jgi:hypothetical protein